MKTRLALALLPLAFVVVGCVHNDRAEPPAELAKIDQTLDIRKIWSNKVGAKIDRLRLGLRPATDGARVFAGSHDGLVTSFDAQTGRKAWSVKTKLPLAAGPTYGEDLLLFGTTDGDLVALDANTGAERWRVAVGSEVLAAPAVASSVVVLRTLDGRLRGFSVGDGSMLWSVEQNMPTLTLRGNTVPRVAGGFVVTGFNNGRVGAYNLNTGEAAWEVAIANPAGRTELDRLVDVGAGLAVVGNDVYVVGYQGRAVGIDLQTGVVLWQQDMSSYAGLGTDVDNVYVTSDFDSVIALDRRRGGSLWRNDALRLRDVTAPTRYENSLVVGDFEGYVHWLDPADGHFIARERAAKARISGAPLVVGNNVYVQSDDGSVTGYTVREKKADKGAEKGADTGA